MDKPVSPALTHSLSEDVLAIFMGSLMIALGVFLFKSVGVLSGGVTGIALLLNQVFGLSFSWLFLLLNLPFFLLGLYQNSKEFAFKSLFCSALVSFWSAYMPYLIQVSYLNPVYAATAGGFVFGMGLLTLIRHKASLGGFTVLALYLQDRYNYSAGKIQMSIDVAILALSFFLTSLSVLLLSILGVVILNLVIVMNHKKGRYRALG